MKVMKQFSFGEMGFLPKAGKQTRKAVFLTEIETVASWPHQKGLIKPFRLGVRSDSVSGLAITHFQTKAGA